MCKKRENTQIEKNKHIKRSEKIKYNFNGSSFCVGFNCPKEHLSYKQTHIHMHTQSNVPCSTMHAITSNFPCWMMHAITGNVPCWMMHPITSNVPCWIMHAITGNVPCWMMRAITSSVQCWMMNATTSNVPCWIMCAITMLTAHSTADDSTAADNSSQGKLLLEYMMAA